MAQIIATATNSYDHKIRLQARRGKFDVIINSSGYCWHYIEKGVSEQKARATFELRRI